MGRRGSGAVSALTAAVGVALLAAASVAWLVSMSRPAQNVERYSRAAIGCTTTLEFAVTGTFYVFEERGGDPTAILDGCAAEAMPGSDLVVELLDGRRSVAVRDDRSVDYETSVGDDLIGVSIGRFEVERTGRYELTAVGPDTAVVLAIGRAPDRGVGPLRLAAIALLGCGSVLFVLSVAQRREIRGSAGSVASPSGPMPWPPPSGPPLG